MHDVEKEHGEREAKALCRYTGLTSNSCMCICIYIQHRKADRQGIKDGKFNTLQSVILP